MQIQPKHPALSGQEGEQAEHRVRPAPHFPTGQEERYGWSKIFSGKIRKAAADFLIRRVPVPGRR